jgi:hypothetical protein
MGKWRYSVTIFFTSVLYVSGQLHAPLYPRHQLDRMLGGPQSRSGSCEVQGNHLPLPGIEPRPSSANPVAVPTELSRLMKWCWSIWKPGSILSVSESEETGNLCCQLVEAPLNPHALLLLTVSYCCCPFVLFPFLWDFDVRDDVTQMQQGERSI